MTIKAIVHEEEDGGFWAEVPSLRDDHFGSGSGPVQQPIGSGLGPKPIFGVSLGLALVSVLGGVHKP